MSRIVRIARTMGDEFALDLLRETEDGVMTVHLGDLASAWNPASTKRMIIGPAVIEYRLWPDGGVSATILEQA